MHFLLSQIEVRSDAVPIVSIRCVSCLASNIFTISRSQHIKLLGQCSAMTSV